MLARRHLVGVGAQCGDVTLLQFIIAASAAVTAPALAFNAWTKAWTTAIPQLQAWARRRGARATLEFVKKCCIDHARHHLGNAELTATAEDHTHQASESESDLEPSGPYFVAVHIPSNNTTLLYVTDEVGEILHFHEHKAAEE